MVMRDITTHPFGQTSRITGGQRRNVAHPARESALEGGEQHGSEEDAAGKEGNMGQVRDRRGALST